LPLCSNECLRRGVVAFSPDQGMNTNLLHGGGIGVVGLAPEAVQIGIG